MRFSVTVAISFLISGAIAQAGTWSVSSTYFFGSGIGTSSPLYRAFNSVNGHNISNGTHYFASSTMGLSMVSGVSNPGASSADAQAATGGASILYTFTYSPNGKTDSPGPTLTVSLALARQQSVSGNTANDTISMSGSLIRQRFTYTTLPSSNSSFGDKEVVMTCTSPVSTTQRSLVRVFFTKLATNHPVNPDAPYHLSATPTPNWFYYWYQTPAYFGQCKYYPGPGSGSCSFSPTGGTWVALVHDGGAWGPAGQNGQRWGASTGIDFFAWICRHEEKHRVDLIALWEANSNRNDTDDGDQDFLPNRFAGEEAGLTPPGHFANRPNEYYDPTIPNSVFDDMDYGAGFRDVEDYCLHRQATWVYGSANHLDWSFSGKQWE